MVLYRVFTNNPTRSLPTPFPLIWGGRTSSSVFAYQWWLVSGSVAAETTKCSASCGLVVVPHHLLCASKAGPCAPLGSSKQRNLALDKFFQVVERSLARNHDQHGSESKWNMCMNSCLLCTYCSLEGPLCHREVHAP